MITLMTAAALAAAQAVPATPPPGAHAQHPQSGQASHSQMNHSKMGHHGGGCCIKAADGTMKCAMQSEVGANGTQQGHSGH